MFSLQIQLLNPIIGYTSPPLPILAPKRSQTKPEVRQDTRKTHRFLEKNNNSRRHYAVIATRLREQVRKGDKLDPCLTRLNTAMPMMTISRLFLFYWLCDILQQMQSRKSGIVVSAIKSTNEIVAKLSLKTDMEKNMARIS